MARKYQFSKLVDPEPGCTFGKYWSWSVRKDGRWLFKYAVQEDPEDLAPDPWDQLPK